MSYSGKHASTSSSSAQPAAPEPSFAERTRTLMHVGRIGSLSTLVAQTSRLSFRIVDAFWARRPRGGRSSSSAPWPCTRRICRPSRAAVLFVTEPDPGGDPLGASRVTLDRKCATRIPEPDLAAARTLYLASYPNSKYWVDFDKLFFYRMEVIKDYS